MNLNEILFFGGFLVLVTLMLVLDLGVFHKKDHVISFKEATAWTCVWITLALIFAVVIYFCAEWIHGIDSMEKLQSINLKHGHNLVFDSALGFEANLEIYRKTLTLEYLTGYLLEKALSIDNIFVMIMIFISFGIDQKYYHRVLFWGIIGAIVLRFIFIFASAALIQRFSWILAVFGGILIISGIKMFFDKNDEKIDTEKHPMVRFCSKYFRLLPQGHGHDFFCHIDGKRYITPLFIVLLVIEFSDVIFAVDSIPAVFSITQDPFMVFFSNIFAILGLRSLFFMLSNVMDMFWALKYGLGVLLTFIGAKMLLHTFWHIEIGTGMSLLVIAGILVLSVVLSLVFPKKEKAIN